MASAACRRNFEDTQEKLGVSKRIWGLGGGASEASKNFGSGVCEQSEHKLGVLEKAANELKKLEGWAGVQVGAHPGFKISIWGQI